MSETNQINPACKACSCYKTAKRVCLKGRNVDERRRLMIFTDYPDYFADQTGKPYALDTGEFIDWLLKRMSINPEDVALDYTLHCYAKDAKLTTKAGRAVAIEECSHYRFASIAKVRPRVIVALGQASMEAFTGKTKVADCEGQSFRAWEGVVADFSDQIWIGYSIAYALISPSDSGRIYRTIYAAARKAGLKPKIDPSIPPFRWRNLL